MYKNIIMAVFMIVTLCQSVQAQTLEQIAGEWTVSKRGQDVDTRTNIEMRITQKWVVSRVGGKVSIRICYIYADGAVDENVMRVTSSSYDNGKLKVTAQTTDRALLVPISTNYEITFRNGQGASGTYVEINNNVSGPSSRNPGRITMLKVSDSTNPSVSTKPASDPVKTNASKAQNSAIKVGAIFTFIEDDTQDIVCHSPDNTIRFIELAIQGGNDARRKAERMIQEGNVIPMRGPAQGKVMQVIRRTVSGKAVILLQIKVMRVEGKPVESKDNIMVWVGLRG